MTPQPPAAPLPAVVGRMHGAEGRKPATDLAMEMSKFTGATVQKMCGMYY